ncbi:hypothetical protein KM043_012662 [Ampulex compressa]|nr:hypothetical protein KM043_012662 [Ampulex compressa]
MHTNAPLISTEDFTNGQRRMPGLCMHRVQMPVIPENRITRPEDGEARGWAKSSGDDITQKSRLASHLRFLFLEFYPRTEPPILALFNPILLVAHPPPPSQGLPFFFVTAHELHTPGKVLRASCL